jgi:hypothetical protein
VGRKPEDRQRHATVGVLARQLAVMNHDPIAAAFWICSLAADGGPVAISNELEELLIRSLRAWTLRVQCRAASREFSRLLNVQGV